jgi:hypothetical protein
MKYKLHKLKNDFVITSDETLIKKGEPYYNTVNHQIFKLDGVVFNHCKKVIAQQNQIDLSNLSEEKQKKIGWVNIEKLANNQYPISKRTYKPEENKETYDYADSLIQINRHNFILGFQKAQELLSDRRFTLEDLKLAFEGGRLDKGNNWYGGDVNQYIQVISQPKSWDIEGEWIDDKFKINKLL